MNLRLPDDVHSLAVDAATADDRSLNSWLIAVVRRAAKSARTNSEDPGPQSRSEQS
ncbi:toxin-antitoxin system HicB family antitoxin [Streptomyces sp. AC1-42W]|nr:toxin-antitoxin system HicB family antitoxin [Streptomyces sp. AC1-42T]PZT83842.1 toxin-antitoxin system HicB family antitoxin [Streptomyces sp. AC1-42W]